ncbi:sulfite exporter TauE/SafE family protein [Neptunomonas qingdaonensis]|uniref:Probable membrane transporter protein n=1 Tax=Neptunomonas qingdaonensis TaxID=1045558 RepID=A0A1I2M4I1_9GAMM|nr:sulfite exporter TauE/SafE family protein [Neptunomonas qingdaonensis]SFF84141.1 Uncharacterized membrane protein YfcA [Neptunomonas qingdaonensis]
MSWLPDGLGQFDLWVLVSMSAFTSMMTAAVGIGGGVLLLAIMAQILPVQALIPVHGLVQLGSNGNRAYMTRQHIDWKMSRLFILGAVVGAVISVWIVIQLPLDVIRLSVAFFILFLVWGPKPKAVTLSNVKLVIAGGVTTIISAFVGATGPLVAAFVHRRNMEKLPTVATFAACMSFQHMLKAMVFVTVGFAFQDWFFVIVLMIISGAVGTWVGLHLLKSLSADLFKQLFRWVVTALALRLSWQVLFSG